jgi:hypothetical protein
MAGEVREASMPIEIEVELYSGRPNPRFTLPATVGAELKQQLADLPPSATDTAGPRNGLGYRGVRIIGHDPSLAEAIVSAGAVEIRDAAGRVLRRADPGRKLERWLIDAGAGHMRQDELDFIRNDFGH